MDHSRDCDYMLNLNLGFDHTSKQAVGCHACAGRGKRFRVKGPGAALGVCNVCGGVGFVATQIPSHAHTV